QVVQLLHGALHRFTSATMDAISSPPPHSIFHVVQNNLCFRLVKPQVALAVGAERVTHELRREIDTGQDAKIVVEQADVGMTGRYTLRNHAARAPTGK